EHRTVSCRVCTPRVSCMYTSKRGTEMNASIKTALTADGQTIAATAGPVIVAVQRVRTSAFRLSIRYRSTGHEIGDLSRSYPVEQTARHAARSAAVLFRSGLIVQQALDLLDVFATTA